MFILYVFALMEDADLGENVMATENVATVTV
jgi:hypothetical protein